MPFRGHRSPGPPVASEERQAAAARRVGGGGGEGCRRGKKGGGSHLLHVVGHLLHRAEGALAGRQRVEESAELLPRRGGPRPGRPAAHGPAALGSAPAPLRQVQAQEQRGAPAPRPAAPSRPSPRGAAPAARGGAGLGLWAWPGSLPSFPHGAGGLEGRRGEGLGCLSSRRPVRFGGFLGCSGSLGSVWGFFECVIRCTARLRASGEGPCAPTGCAAQFPPHPRGAKRQSSGHPLSPSHGFPRARNTARLLTSA